MESLGRSTEGDGEEMMFEPVIINGDTWLICGGRNFENSGVFQNAMSDLLRMKG